MSTGTVLIDTLREEQERRSLDYARDDRGIVCQTEPSPLTCDTFALLQCKARAQTLPDERDSRTVVLLVTVRCITQGKPHRRCGLVGPAAWRLRVRRPGRGKDLPADCYKHRQDGIGCWELAHKQPNYGLDV